MNEAERLKAWAESNGLSRASGRPCAIKVIGKRCPIHCSGRFELTPLESGCRPPGSDHDSLWFRWVPNGTGRRRVYVFVTQPYSWDAALSRAALAWGDRLGMEFHITAWQSWHYPGHSLAVVWTPKGVQAPQGGGEEDRREQ